MTDAAPKITLRPFTRAEYHAFYRDYVADPVMDPNRYEYSHEHVDRCFDYDLTRKDWYPVFGIFDAVDEPVGSLSLKRIDRERSRCEIGIVLQNDACKGLGYGTAAMRAAIDHAANTLGLRHIYADTMGSNLCMQHIFDKLGFRLIERIPHVYDMHDRWEDKLDYVLEMPARLLIGTTNPSKLRLMQAWFTGLNVVCVSPAELGLQPDIPEDAHTAEENAIQKAVAWHRASGLPVLAEDSGFVLLDLPKEHPDQPGVRVRRAPGYAMDDEQMLAYYQALAHRHGGSIRAAYCNALCFLQDSDHYATYCDDAAMMARHAFLLTDRPCETRHPGWPLDSISICPANGRYYAEMTDDDFAAVRQENAATEDIQRRQHWLEEQAMSL